MSHNFLIFLVCSVVFIPFISTSELQLSDKYKVAWYQSKSDSITFEISVELDGYLNDMGYIGFGISQNGNMRGADIVTIMIGSVAGNTTKKSVIMDMHGVGNMKPVLDSRQDYKLEQEQRNGTRLMFKISRLINTCDMEDLEITSGSTQYIIWSMGKVDEMTKEIKYHTPMNRGSKPVNLLDLNMKTPDFSQYMNWPLYQNIVLTTAETLYWCKIHRAPKLDRKNHIVGFGINVRDPLAKIHTHHASVLSCEPPYGQDAEAYFSKFMDPMGFDCYYSEDYYPVDRCKTFDFQWAYGGMPTAFPENVGIPLGESDNKFYMTMLHINNPQRAAGEFTAGFDLYYTPNLRSVDAGFFQLGINSSKAFALTVPPNSADYLLSSHCPPECLRALPSSGINVFVYLLHFHLTGRKMRIRHFRNGTELPWLANDENYDTNFQNGRLLKNEVVILPNDHLTVECTYDSTDRNGSTVIGGRGILDEMCQAFLMYYPKIREINRCGSSVPQMDLLKFMDIQKILMPPADNDPIILEPLEWKGLRYTQIVEKKVNWTKEQRWAFEQMTKNNYHEAECTAMGKGVRISTKYPLVDEVYRPLDTCKGKLYSGSGKIPGGSGIIGPGIQLVISALVARLVF